MNGRDLVVAGVVPVGSVLARPGVLNGQKSEYRAEGIGYDFVPRALDQAAPDVWVKTSDEGSFWFVRRLVKEEGILCGGSSAAAFAGLVQYLRAHPEDNVEDRSIVLIFQDSLRSFLTTIADNSWMEINGFSKDQLSPLTWIWTCNYNSLSNSKESNPVKISSCSHCSGEIGCIFRRT